MSENRRPSSTTGTGEIRCPYFVAHGNMEIICEGIVDGTRTVTKFPGPEERKFHQNVFCEKCYKKCEIAAAVEHFRWAED